MYKKLLKYFGVFLTLFSVSLVAIPSTFAASVEPVPIDGSSTVCSDLDTDWFDDIKFEFPVIGTTATHDIVVNEVVVATITIEITAYNSESEEVTFDWSTTNDFGIDAVIVKGGTGGQAAAYYYVPESTGDTGLQTYTGQGISNIQFCYDWDLTIGKETETGYTVTYDWCLDKNIYTDVQSNDDVCDDSSDADAEAWELYAGETATNNFQLVVDRSVAGYSEFYVKSIVTVTNNTPFSATQVKVTDALDDATFGTEVTMSCEGKPPVFSLTSGESVTCEYTFNPAGATTTTSGTNYARAVTGNNSVVGGADTSAAYDFATTSDTNITEENATATLSDSQYDLNGDAEGTTVTLSGDDVIPYSLSYDCDDAGHNVNTATLTEENGDENKDDVTVTITCANVLVDKTAPVIFTREWDWTVVKSADVGTNPADNPETSAIEVLLQEGQDLAVLYNVAISATFRDYDFDIAEDTGTISVTNNASTRSLDLESVEDVLNGLVGGVSTDVPVNSVVCNKALPTTLSPSETLSCTYDFSDLEDTFDSLSGVTNTATASYKLYNFAVGEVDEEVLPSPAGSESKTVAISVATTPSTKIDECITLTDTFYDEFGNDGVDRTVTPNRVCAGDLTNGSTTASIPSDLFTFECGYWTVRNVVSYVSDDGESGDSEVVINVTVDCQDGCTLTIGYWKTHSAYGPVARLRYADGWDFVDEYLIANGFAVLDVNGNPLIDPMGEDIQFFDSGETWFEMLNNAPQGSPYRVLARQYIGAVLNVQAGASPTDIQAELDLADAFFSTFDYSRGTDIKGKGAKDIREEIGGWSSLFDEYNNGKFGDIGPGHCTEDFRSDIE